MKKTRLLFAVAALLTCLTPRAQASGEGTAGDYLYGMGAQFGRGLVNVVTSPAEIPCTMTQDVKEDGGVGLATGFGKGTWYMLRRILVGVSEVGTFFLPDDRTLAPVCQQKPQANLV